MNLASPPATPRILAVDDDPSVRRILDKILTREGYVVQAVGTGAECIEAAKADPPDLIALDVLLPDMDGFEVCRQLREAEELSGIPIVFLTTLWRATDRTHAFRVGATDWLQKPFEPDALVTTVSEQVARPVPVSVPEPAPVPVPESTPEPPAIERPTHWHQWALPRTFKTFLNFLSESAQVPEEVISVVRQAPPRELYSGTAGVPPQRVAQAIGEFLGVPFVQDLDASNLVRDVLPLAFCQRHRVAPIVMNDVVHIACSNPFVWELLDTLGQTVCERKGSLQIVIVEPQKLGTLIDEHLEKAASAASATAEDRGEEEQLQVLSERDDVPVVRDTHPILILANEVLRAAVAARASDVHVEAKADYTLVRCRVDGDMHDLRKLDAEAAPMLISRFKALAGMDIAEKRKPQDGALEVMLGTRRFKLRLATSLASDGESLVIRLLEPGAAAKPFTDLGMTAEQAAVMEELSGRHQGMVLMVGPTGSGKSTTIFSLLSAVNGQVRSIMSVEDPVEYRIPYANQQQVNEKAGATFESLLRSAMRQDPDILFLGEIRDAFSAKASMDFASSGHLTVSTLHSSNATTAVFRLERLNVSRGAMADSLLAVIAQKLLKKLCDHCKSLEPITEEERANLSRFTDSVPEVVARPVGCEACHGTGYLGREGCYEILRFDPSLGERVRRGDSVAQIRAFAEQRGDFLISDHAIQKVREHTYAPDDVYQQVLLEEVRFMKDGTRGGGASEAAPEVAPQPAPVAAPQSSPPAVTPPTLTTEMPAVLIQEPPSAQESDLGTQRAAKILVVDDDPDARELIRVFLESAGYEITLADDGVDALIKLGQDEFDLILSDLNMPNLDGFKLMEMIVQKGITTPTAFLTGTDSVEIEGQLLAMGAAEYIRKPIRPGVLTARVARALRFSTTGRGPAPLKE